MFSVLQFVSIWLQVGSSLPKLATSWLKEAASWLERAQVGTRIAQVGANMVPRWPKLRPIWLHGSPSARQSGPKWVQVSSNMGEVRLKTAQSESKLSPSEPLVPLNWVKMASILHEGGKSKNA